ncbi:hypothetical protein K1719_002096 [Acacia pycnantha]|nr:hypothetical protein K1719_002096 [Acacia pycnantha]
MAASTRSRTNAPRPPHPPEGQPSFQYRSQQHRKEGRTKIETEDTTHSPHPSRVLQRGRPVVQVQGIPQPQHEFQINHPNIRLLHNTVGSMVRRMDNMENRHQLQQEDNTRVIREELERQNATWRLDMQQMLKEQFDAKVNHEGGISPRGGVNR